MRVRYTNFGAVAHQRAVEASHFDAGGATCVEDNAILGGSGCPQTIGSGMYLLLCKDGAAHSFTSNSAPPITFASCGFTFGIGGGDEVKLYLSASQATILDETGPGCCAGVSSASYGRMVINGSVQVIIARLKSTTVYCFRAVFK